MYDPGVGTTDETRCGACGRGANEVLGFFRIAFQSGDRPLICNRCVADLADKAAQARHPNAKTKQRPPLKKPREIKAHLDKYVIGQDQAKRTIALAVYNHFKRREDFIVRRREEKEEDIEINKSNILLLGPSGTGKTEIARSIARLLKIPFHVADATKLTMSGYVGDDVESLLQGLVSDAGGEVERAEWGIVVVDECDKMARKSGRGSTGFRDVTGEGVQQALLKLVEGSKISVPRNGSKAGVGAPSDLMDTSNVLFIFAGSFAGMEEIVQRRLSKSSRIGFGTDTVRPRDLTLSEVYDHVTEDDFLEFGLIPELLGRLPVRTSTRALTEEELVRILTEPRNALIKQHRKLFSLDGIDLQFDDDALRAIAHEATKRTTGARALATIVEAVIAPFAFDAPSDSTIESIRVTADAVIGNGEAEILRKVVSLTQAVG